MNLGALTLFQDIQWLNMDDPGLLVILAIFVLGVVYTLLEGQIPVGEDAFEGFLFTVLVYGGGLLIFYGGFHTYRRLQLIRGTPTSKIRSMAMGTVELKGKAEKGAENHVLESPFTGKECLFYRYRVEEYRHDDDGGNWVTIDSGREGTRFVLKDETGEVIVDPDGADLDIPADNTFEMKGFDDAPSEIQSFIRENEAVNRDSNELLSLFDNKRKYTEWYVTPGEDIYVFGYASKENDDVGEYEVIKDHKSTPMFLISDKSEKQLRNEKSWKYKAMIIGGILAAPAGLALMFLITGIL